MSARAEGSNAPLRKGEKQALKRQRILQDRYVAEGMSEEDAARRAERDMRDNGRGDWRQG